MDVVIVCHTEFGFVNKKRIVIADKAHKEGVEKGVQGLLEICKNHNAKTTFAVMPEVAGYFPKVTGHEVGLHIHPGWGVSGCGGEEHYIGDAYLKENCSQSVDSTVLQDFPYAEQLNMIRAGRECLKERLKVEPRTFVSGRWSENSDTIKALLETGFTHDCSPIPGSRRDHYDWSHLPRICMPYHPGSHDYQARGDLPLLIIPVSRMWLRGIVNPESAAVVGLPWLKACFIEYYSQGLPLFHICLHSPSMTSPYFISIMDEFLNFIGSHKVKFKLASEIRESNPVNTRTRVSPYLFAVNGNLIRGSLQKLFYARDN